MRIRRYCKGQSGRNQFRQIETDQLKIIQDAQALVSYNIIGLLPALPETPSSDRCLIPLQDAFSAKDVWHSIANHLEYAYIHWKARNRIWHLCLRFQTLEHVAKYTTTAKESTVVASLLYPLQLVTIWVSRIDERSNSENKLDTNPSKISPRQKAYNEEFLGQTKVTCMRIRTSQENRIVFLRCLSNFVGDEKNIFLVRSTSPTEQIIFLKSFLVKEDFGKHCLENFMDVISRFHSILFLFATTTAPNTKSIQVCILN